MRGKSLALSLCLSIAASTGLADEVHLESGRVIEGAATQQGDKVVIAIESGRITVSRDEVARIERSASPLAQVEERDGRLAPDDRAGLLKLADFCRDHDLPAKERELLLRVIARAPDDLTARRRLGFVHTPDGWVERAELAQRRAELSTAQRLAELEVAQKRAELSLAEARVTRERAQTRSDAQREAAPKVAEPAVPQPYYPYSPYAYYPSAGIVVSPHPPHPVHNVTPPHVMVPPPNYAINGVRDPASFIDDMQRRR